VSAWCFFLLIFTRDFLRGRHLVLLVKHVTESRRRL
jgi:hypothetical protein